MANKNGTSKWHKQQNPDKSQVEEDVSCFFISTFPLILPGPRELTNWLRPLLSMCL